LTPFIGGLTLDYYFVEDSLKDKGVRNIVRVKKGVYSHFQIEKKNGLTFMRFKRRRIDGN